jgi:predicted DNA-binding protein (MmcQ/YjbR family)
MLTRDDIRRTALTLPEAYEEPHFHMASFRVAKKIFCTLHDPEPRIMLKFDPEDQHNLSDGEVILPVPGPGVARARPSSTSRSWIRSGCRI